MRREYLDGLRGWAALAVVFSHLGPMFLMAKQPLTIVPFVSDGQLAVYVFFALSAFVLSIGYFERRDAGILVALGVRRYPRLTIPIAASCFLAFVLVEAGAMANIEAGKLASSEWLSSFYTFDVSWWSLLRFSLFDVYVDPNANTYNAVLWTMRYELWGSLILLGGLWCLRKRYARWAGYLVAGALCYYFSSALLAFVFGAVLAELTPKISAVTSSSPRRARAAAWLLLLSALLASTFRSGMLWSPIALSLIAAAILLSILLSPPMKRFLSSKVSVTLGHLSFPLYLTHLLVICSWSSWLYIWLHNKSVETLPLSITVAVSSVGMALLAAAAFSPVETWAIRFSRAFSTLLLGRRRTDPGIQASSPLTGP